MKLKSIIYTLCLSWLVLITPVWAQSYVKVTFRVDVPHQLPASARVYLVGNHPSIGPWNPGKLNMRRVSSRRYEVQISLPKGYGFQYKYTLGNWKLVEKGPQMEELPNRTVKITANQVVHNRVSQWFNYHLLKNFLPTYTGHIDEINNIYSPQLKNTRSLWIYLPPSYYTSVKKRYPVLYMHDGNNIFDARRAFGRVEWGVDEIVQKLIAQKKIPEIIVVGVSNTRKRMGEYTPVKDQKYGGGEAAKYAQFLTKTVKPLIDSRYRTKSGRTDTAVMGSSLGGLVSMYLGWKHSKTFSRIGVVSPSIWWSNKHLLQMIQKDPRPTQPLRIWLDMGTRESQRDANHNKIPDTVEEARALRDHLKQKKFTLGKDLGYMEAQGAGHNEYSWNKRLDKILIFLYKK